MSCAYFNQLWPRIFRKIFRRIAADLYIYILILLYSTFSIGIVWIYGDVEMLSHLLYFEKWTIVFLMIMPVVAIACDLFVLVHRFDRRRTLAFRRIFSARRLSALIGGLLLLGAIMFLQGSYTSIKNILPNIRGGFVDDRYQADLDAWLHMGVDPWVLVHSIFGNDLLRAVIDFNYGNLWFIVCFGTLFFVATSPLADSIRRRYMWMFAFVWVVCGNVLAGLFLSAGPVYYGHVVGDHDRFADLVAFLGRDVSESSAAGYQAYLWKLYASGMAGFGGGISAFPSIHVGLITLNALFINEYSRRWGVVAFVYVGLIQLSSIYLGWHYAIDGYMSIIVVTVAFLLSGSFGRRSSDRNAVAVTPSAVGAAAQ